MSQSTTPGALKDLTVLVTRPKGQASDLVAALRAEGAEAIELPAIAIEPPDSFDALDAAVEGDAYNWAIFTSANGVDAFFDRLAALQRGSEWFEDVQTAAIGPATARSLRAHGVAVDLVPDEYVAEALLACLSDAVPLAGQRILLPRADIARDVLVQGLRDAGAIVDAVDAYRTVQLPTSPGLAERLRSGQVDAVTFTSPSTVRAFLSMLGSEADVLRQTKVACIGPVTATAARQADVDVDIVAARYTVAGLVEALRAYYQRQPTASGR
jgi:uroporphyrinogen-III synthase